MGFEHIADARHIIDRMDLPKRFKAVIAEIEEKTRPIDQLDEKAATEVNRVLALVGGDTLCAAIVVRLLEQYPEMEELKPERIPSQEDRWKKAAHDNEGLTLLLIDDNYLAFNEQAHRISEATGVHTHRIGRTDCIALNVGNQPDWVGKLQQHNLDVALCCENSDGWDKINVLDMDQEEQPPAPETELPPASAEQQENPPTADEEPLELEQPLTSIEVGDPVEVTEGPHAGRTVTVEAVDVDQAHIAYFGDEGGELVRDVVPIASLKIAASADNGGGPAHPIEETPAG